MVGRKPSLVSRDLRYIAASDDSTGSERIPPLSRVARQILIKRYCPTEIQNTVRTDPTNSDCLVRIYLGSRPTARFATTQLHSTQLQPPP